MSKSTLLFFRKIHLYFGLFISPALLFFALTGCVQTLSLHEAAGRSYSPPHWLAELGQLHKKQTPVLPEHKASAVPSPSNSADKPGPGRGASPGAAVPAMGPQASITLAAKQRQHLPLKIFFLIVGLGLLCSTLTGIYMTFQYERNTVLLWSTLVAGVVAPLVLVRF